MKISALLITLTFSLFTPSAIADSKRTACKKKDQEIKAEIAYGEGDTHLPCRVVVRKSREKFETEHNPWTAKSSISFCETKFAGYIAKLQSEGWQCTGEAEAPLASPPAQAAVSSTPTASPPDVPGAPPVQAAAEAAPEPAQEPAPASRAVTLYGVAATLDYLRLDARDSNGVTSTVLSNSPNPGLNVSFGKAWSSRWAAIASLGGTYTSLQLNSSMDTLSNAQNFLWTGSVTGQRALNERFTLGLQMIGAQRVFLARSGAATLMMDRLTMFDLLALAKARLFQAHQVDFGGELTLGYLFSGSDSVLRVRAGTSYHLGLYAERLPFRATVYYEQRYQNTSLTDWRQTEAGLILSVDFKCGG